MEFKISGPGFYKSAGGFKAYVVGRSQRQDGWLVEAINDNNVHDGQRWVADDCGRCDEVSILWRLVAEWKEPKRIKGWVNVFASSTVAGAYLGHICQDKAEAERSRGASSVTLACIEIDVVEGQGLDGSAVR